MLGFARVAFRQAQDALKCGRLEEARRILTQPDVQGRAGLNELLGTLAQAFLERGERGLRREDAENAWNDLRAAEELKTAEKGSDKLREALTRLGLAEVRALLQAGEPGRAAEAVARLQDRGVRVAELGVLAEAALDWVAGRDLANQGEFVRAAEAADRAARLLRHDNPRLDEFRRGLPDRQRKLTPLLTRLHGAAGREGWPEVIEVAEDILALAPQHEMARKLRSRAWKAVEPVTVHQAAAAAPPEVLPAAEAAPPARYLLWVDGVGGFLVCMAPRVSLGQLVGKGQADVPVAADVSRLHAHLTRDPEGYTLEAVRGVRVNGHTIDRAILRCGDRFTLGEACQFQFRQPVPVSGTARLDLVSGHRLPQGLDAVLLLADTLVLGGGSQAHVAVPDLKANVVLFRHKDALGVRMAGVFGVNGVRTTDRGLLGSRAVVAGDEVSFTVEPAGPRLG